MNIIKMNGSAWYWRTFSSGGKCVRSLDPPRKHQIRIASKNNFTRNNEEVGWSAATREVENWKFPRKRIYEGASGLVFPATVTIYCWCPRDVLTAANYVPEAVFSRTTRITIVYSCKNHMLMMPSRLRFPYRKKINSPRENKWQSRYGISLNHTP